MKVVTDLERFEEIKHEMVVVPGGFDDYFFHIDKQLLFSTITNKFLLKNAIGTGDDNKYIGTTLKNRRDGKSYNFYLHEISYACENGMEKSMWRSMPIPLEIDHQFKETKNNNPKFLSLKTSKGNKANKTFVYNKNRVNLKVARELREQFRLDNPKNKIEWYAEQSKRLGIGKRSIQNIILNVTYKEDEYIG